MKLLKRHGLPDYYRQKINLHEKLQKQLREELLKLDEKNLAPDPDIALRDEVKALLDRYNYSPTKMLKILS